MDCVVELKHISKEFPGVKVLDDVNLSLYPGEVLGICGENGAGKSTLIKILTGLYQPDGGSIEIEGKEEKLDAIKAKELGMSAIYQELTIVPELSLAENIFLGHPPTAKSGIIDHKAMYEKAGEILKELGMDYDPAKTKAGDLSIGNQQLIEVGKAIGQKGEGSDYGRADLFTEPSGYASPVRSDPEVSRARLCHYFHFSSYGRNLRDHRSGRGAS